MTGLQRILKLYGSTKVNGVLWVWDYVKNEPRIKSEMTSDEWKASEKVRYDVLKKLMEP